MSNKHVHSFFQSALQSFQESHQAARASATNVYKDSLDAASQCARECLYEAEDAFNALQGVSPPFRSALKMVMHADRQIIDAATSRMRDLEEQVAYRDRRIEELQDQVNAMPHIPAVIELMSGAYHTLHPNHYIDERRDEALQARRKLESALNLLGVTVP